MLTSRFFTIVFFMLDPVYYRIEFRIGQGSPLHKPPG